MPRARAFLAACLLTTTLVALAPAGAEDVPVHTVTGDEVYADGTYVFYDPIVVASGTSLTFRNATVYLDQSSLCTGETNVPGAYQCRPHVEVSGGTLRVLDSTVTTRLPFEHHDDGWRVESSAGVLLVERSTLLRYKEIVVAGAAAAPSAFRDSDLGDAVGPVWFQTGATGVFERNRVHDVRGGVFQTDATARIWDNLFERVDRSYGTSVRYPIYLHETVSGDRAYETPSDIRRNVVNDSRWGILVQASYGGVIEDNVVRRVSNGIGITVGGDSLDVSRTPPAVHRNLVDGANNSLLVSATLAQLSTGVASERLDATDNAFVNTGCTDVRVQHVDDGFTLEVDVRSSWWGSPLGPQPHGTCDAVHDPYAGVTVLTSPWRTSEPEWA